MYDNDYEFSSDESMFGFWTQIINPQSYKNILYLLLSFPVSLISFLLLTIGGSLGFGLLAIIIGIPILIATYAGAIIIADWERTLANQLLGTRLPMAGTALRRGDFWREGIKAFLNIDHWKSIFFLGLRFPFAVVSFALTVTIVALTAGLLTAPLSVSVGNPMVEIGGWQFSSMPSALLAFVIGLVLLPFGLLAINVMARLWRMLTEAMLSVSPSTAHLDHAFTDKQRYVIMDDDPFMADDPFESDSKPKRDFVVLDDGEIAYRDGR